jgi:hypothetical protein
LHWLGGPGQFAGRTGREACEQDSPAAHCCLLADSIGPCFVWSAFLHLFTIATFISHRGNFSILIYFAFSVTLFLLCFCGGDLTPPALQPMFGSRVGSGRRWPFSPEWSSWATGRCGSATTATHRSANSIGVMEQQVGQTLRVQLAISDHALFPSPSSFLVPACFLRLTHFCNQGLRTLSRRADSALHRFILISTHHSAVTATADEFNFLSRSSAPSLAHPDRVGPVTLQWNLYYQVGSCGWT